MDASDAIALRQLYLFSVDCQLFPAFARDLRSHIQVSRILEYKSLLDGSRIDSVRLYLIRKMTRR